MKLPTVSQVLSAGRKLVGKITPSAGRAANTEEVSAFKEAIARARESGTMKVLGEDGAVTEETWVGATSGEAEGLGKNEGRG